ncbi:MAG: DUF4905 domain-containing protein [Cytophagales bacterium]|nr:DUF4905 domain-containing protein [Bernardetiaceae bacterium]MDW8209724.1 DUF4905 domain-containing protein [Cytophagales bacterium]
MTELLEYFYPGMCLFRVANNPELQQDLLAIEFRSASSVSFSVLDLNHAILLLDNWQPDFQPQTFHLAGVTAHLLLLYRQSGRQYPDPKGIWAWDLATQKLRWKQTEDYLVEVKQHVLSVYAVEQGIIHRRKLNPDTGVPLEKIISLEGPSALEKVGTPVVYSPQSPHFEPISQYLQQIAQQKPFSTIHYWENDHYMLFACDNHRQELQWFAYDLAKERLVNQITLANHLNGIAEDTFFVISNRWVVLLFSDGVRIFEM